MGIEPTSAAWKAAALPLSYARTLLARVPTRDRSRNLLPWAAGSYACPRAGQRIDGRPPAGIAPESGVPLRPAARLPLRTLPRAPSSVPRLPPAKLPPARLPESRGSGDRSEPDLVDAVTPRRASCTLRWRRRSRARSSERIARLRLLEFLDEEIGTYRGADAHQDAGHGAHSGAGTAHAARKGQRRQGKQQDACDRGAYALHAIGLPTASRDTGSTRPSPSPSTPPPAEIAHPFAFAAGGSPPGVTAG